MYLDKFGEFADAVSVGTPSNSTVNVGDVIDLASSGGAVGDLGVGKDDIYVVVRVADAITSGGAATVQARVVSDSVSTPAVDGTATTHLVTTAVAVASLVAGYEFIAAKLPKGTYERYLGIQLTETATQALTGGTLNAFLTRDLNAFTAYPDRVK